MSALRLAHISDLHLPPPDAAVAGLRQRLSKRQLSLWSWQRRGHLQRPEILDALRDALRAADPEHLAITGDVVNFSLPAEFRAAAGWLASLLPAERISLVPGNHDALVRLSSAQGLDQWAAWTRLPKAGWPFVHRVGFVSLIGACSATATAPGLAQGRLGRAQRERLREVLRAEAPRCRVLLLHHPVVDGAVGWRKALRDRAALQDLLHAEGAELILHGHARDARLDRLPGPGKSIPVLCVPSSSALPSAHDEGARWHLLEFSNGAGGWQLTVRVRRWSVAVHAFRPAGGYRLWLPRSESPGRAAA